MKYRFLLLCITAAYSSLAVGKASSGIHITDKYGAGYGIFNSKAQTATICSQFKDVEDMPTEDAIAYKTPHYTSRKNQKVICARSQAGQTTYVGIPSQVSLESLPKQTSGQSIVDAHSAGFGTYYEKTQTLNVCSKYTYVQKHNTSTITERGYSLPPNFVICGKSLDGSLTYIGIPVKGSLTSAYNMKRAKGRI